MYPQIPTAFSKDKLYDFVFCVWIVNNANPITDNILPNKKLTKNGPTIIHPVPMNTTNILYNNSLFMRIFRLINYLIVFLPGIIFVQVLAGTCRHNHKKDSHLL